MKHVATALLLAALAAPAGADESKGTLYEVEEVKNLAYLDKGADEVRHRLDLYLPRGQKNYPVLFFIHGGGWRNGSKDGFANHGRTFARHGIAFVATNYRLSPKVQHPEHIKDVARAFAFARQELKKRGADLSQVYVCGHSAGGHLCALLASDESYLKEHQLTLKDIRGCIPISGVFTVGGGPKGRPEIWGEDAEVVKKASPMVHIARTLPPFLVFYADKEIAGLGKQGDAFGAALKKAGGQVTVRMIKDRDHGTIMRNAAKADDEVTRAIFAFIKGGGALKVLGD